MRHREWLFAFPLSISFRGACAWIVAYCLRIVIGLEREKQDGSAGQMARSRLGVILFFFSGRFREVNEIYEEFLHPPQHSAAGLSEFKSPLLSVLQLDEDGQRYEWKTQNYQERSNSR